MTLNKFLESNPDKMLVRGAKVKRTDDLFNEIATSKNESAIYASHIECRETTQDGGKVLIILEPQTKQWVKLYDIETIH